MDEIDWAKKALRRASYRWPPRYACKVAARVERGKYRCNICENLFSDKQVQVDHKEPVVGMEGYVNLDTYAKRLLVSIDKFQVLCKPCHKTKSVGENAIRRKNRVK